MLYDAGSKLGVRGVTAICNALVRADARVYHLILEFGDSKAMSVICSMLRANSSIRYIKLYNTVANSEDDVNNIKEQKCFFK